jgi:glycine/D-amino acid oxidase-like deaminating enzyme
MSSKESRILIVGQGIAGTALAWRCLQLGYRFTILDDGHKSSSSLAAAGLFNPLILKRRRLTWRAEEFMDVLYEFYDFVEQKLGVKFLHRTGIWRRMTSIEEVNDWQSLLGNSSFSAFLGEQSQEDRFLHISSSFGYQEVKDAGYVDVEMYLDRSREYFSSIHAVQEVSLDMTKSLQENGISIASYDHVILSTGYKAMDSNFYFPELPFTPAKGHTLEIECKTLDLGQMVNGPCFIIPIGNGRFRIGSTYSWDNFNNQVEEDQVERLKKSFESMCDLPYTVRRAWAGVRPVIKDRKPIIGTSEKDSKVHIFNGLGSRAIGTTPLLSSHLLRGLFADEKIWDEVSLSRFSA